MTDPTIEIRHAPFAWAQSAEYSQAARIGDIVYTAGQGGFSEDGNLVGGGFAEQTRQALRNLEAVLHGHGTDLASVIKLTVHIPNVEDYASFKLVRREFFGEPWPASTAISSQLLVPGMLVEIEAIAAVGARRAQASRQ
ncbi:RidA family protein [Mycolicibacterium sp. P9-64]|uniref:RidA family protein n=1 Tax=Mycolicibacterium sp. P9-64 TaxID=2024612 RepID=UPI0011EE2B1A|nr:RidA family protein [Mycolicibacterium sp. P9-64]KAA0084576.1 RidA family protein [Mycolicibacterium sp. P9-64]